MQSIATTIESLWIYPVKSLAGISLKRCEMTPHGLKGDRQWMIVDDKGGFVSQRKLPKMGLIKTALSSNQELTLSLAGKSITIHPNSCTKSCQTQVWQDECWALEAPSHINEWLNNTLDYKKPLRLVYFDLNTHRTIDVTRFGNHTTFFADAAPILLCNSTSLEALNIDLQSKGCAPISMARFRPNIVISTAQAFDEHHYTHASTPNLSFNLIDHCQRCSIITINPETASSEDATLLFHSLSALNAMPNNPKAPAFGVNCTSKKSSLGASALLSQGVPITLFP